MGRIQEEIYFSSFFTKILKEQFFSLFPFFLKNPQNVWCFCFIRDGGALENFLSPLLGGVKICLREGDCVLEGQPMRIPPLPLPLAQKNPFLGLFRSSERKKLMFQVRNQINDGNEPGSSRLEARAL